MISVLILSHNEEANLPACLESLSWCDDIIVLDSLSTDRTVAIAEAHAHTRIVRRPFDNFAGQRNHALDQIDFKHDWIFHLDADERFTPELLQACREAVRQDRCSGYLVPAKTMFMGKWLRWSAGYPVYQVRFHKRGEMRFMQQGHGQREDEVVRSIEKLDQPYLHYSFSKGLDDWFAKHNRYSSDEARQFFEASDSIQTQLTALLSAEPLQRRRALKSLSMRFPARGFLRFCYMYGLHLGFLDGKPGYYYCRLVALYESMIALKIKGRQWEAKGHPL